MGFPYDTPSWDVVSEVMFMGWGGAMPGLYSTLGLIACAAVLYFGNKYEKKRYDNHKE